MNRRQLMILSGAAFAMRGASAEGQQAPQAAGPGSSGAEQGLPDKLLLKDYRPKSIFKIPKTEVPRAKFPAIDAHYHARARTPEELDREVKLMDAVGVERTVVFCGTGTRFDEACKLHSKYASRFDVWCGLDLRGNDQPGFAAAVVKELERCHALGARGVGEIIDKGMGFGAGGGAGRSGRGSARPTAHGPHADDARLDAVFDKCAELKMPVNIHVSDPIWGYEPQDKTNDGLMNAFTWRLDNKPGIMGHNDLIESLERAAKKHPKTVFIASHLANLDYDLTRLGQMFDRNPNLYADISARFAEISPIPRFAGQFFEKYAHRLVYGTDMGYNRQMFLATFRILESHDEHFYEYYSYHWPQHGLGLPDDVLKKVYRETALNAFKQASQ